MAAVTGEIARGPVALATIVAALVLVWCWLLPMLGRTEPLRRRIEQTERLGINPAAIYYTDVFESSTRTTEGNTDAIDHRR